MSTQNDTSQRSTSEGSDDTLAIGNGPFDFEKTLRIIMRKYVYLVNTCLYRV